MKILTVFYSKKFPYAKYLNEEIGFDASLDNGEDPLLVAGKLKDLATDFFYVTNTHLLPPEDPEISAVPRRKPPVSNVAHESERDFTPSATPYSELEDGIVVIQDGDDRKVLKKIKPDVVTMKKYMNAIKEKDQKTIDEILLNYDIKTEENA